MAKRRTQSYRVDVRGEPPGDGWLTDWEYTTADLRTYRCTATSREDAERQVLAVVRAEAPTFHWTVPYAP